MLIARPQDWYQPRCALDAASQTFPCSGTAITIVNPNDLGAGGWSNLNCTATGSSAADPSGTPLSASTVTSTGTGAYSEIVYQGITSPTGGVTMRVAGYLKPVAGPSWVLIQVQDLTSFDGFGSWFNLSGANGTAGTAVANGTGVTLACHLIQASTNGYYQFSFSGAFNTTPSGTTRFQIFLVDADGSGTGTVGQQINAWGIGT